MVNTKIAIASNGEITLILSQEEKQAVVDIDRGSEELGYAYCVDGQFVPGKELYLSTDAVPPFDLVNYFNE